MTLECRYAYLLAYFTISNVTVFVAYVNTLCDFNTSNVTIQLWICAIIFVWVLNFNTSNVTIQRGNFFISFFLLTDFNTSNVTIQQGNTRHARSISKISIHLMLLFNWLHSQKRTPAWNISIHLMLLFNLLLSSSHHNLCHFNTSNVTIQRTICALFGLLWLFQYI